MVKVRSRPVVKEAVKWTGENWEEIVKFCPSVRWDVDPVEHRDLSITTLEGEMHASIGDWIVKGVNGEFYPVKPDIFVKSYEMWTGYE